VEYVEVDQREIQRLGGRRSRFPVSQVVKDLIKPLDPAVLDVTYGRGRFYYLFRPRVLIGSDPFKWDWLVEPDAFYQLTAWALYHRLRRGEVRLPQEVTLVVADPPRWTRGAVYRGRDEFTALIGTPELIIRYAYEAARLVGASHFLVHYSTVPELSGAQVLKVVRFRYLSRYLNTRSKNTSYFVLYRL
jgi:hypothetical protein